MLYSSSFLLPMTSDFTIINNPTNAINAAPDTVINVPMELFPVCGRLTSAPSFSVPMPVAGSIVDLLRN